MSEFLKCDAEGCDHREDVAKITADMVGKPCPKCGANLLTQADWDVYDAAFRPLMEAMEKAGLSRLATQADRENPAAVMLSVNHHDGATILQVKRGAA
jgi:hypothetical protein